MIYLEHDDGVIYENEGKLCLKKHESSKTLSLGHIIDKNGMKILLKNETDHDLQRKEVAWTVLRKIVPYFDGFQYTTKNATYKIAKSKLMDVKSYKSYTGDFIDSKYIVPVKHWHVTYDYKPTGAEKGRISEEKIKIINGHHSSIQKLLGTSWTALFLANKYDWQTLGSIIQTIHLKMKEKEDPYPTFKDVFFKIKKIDPSFITKLYVTEFPVFDNKNIFSQQELEIAYTSTRSKNSIHVDVPWSMFNQLFLVVISSMFREITVEAEEKLLPSINSWIGHKKNMTVVKKATSET